MKNKKIPTIEESIAKVNSLGYFVQNIFQAHNHPSSEGWQVTLRNPYSWFNMNERGKTLAEACDKAASKAAKQGEAKPLTAVQEAAVQSNTAAKSKRKRVRLGPKRVRL